MKKVFRKFRTAVLLTAAALALLTAGAGAKKAEGPYQQAIVETALAYFHRGAAIQYDSIALGGQGRDGQNAYYANLRESEGFSPEDATVSNTVFSVCSAWCWEVYREVLGVELSSYQLYKTAYLVYRSTPSDPDVVIRWTEEEPDGRTKEEAIAEAWEQIQPGDIIVAMKKKNSGHAMLYVGDILDNGTEYLIHCIGSKYNMAGGKDAVETQVLDYRTQLSGRATRGGAMKREVAYDYCFNTKVPGGYALINSVGFVILRPLNKYPAAEYPLTENALARIATPGVNVDRQASCSKYQSVAPGEEIVLTLKIENVGTETFSVPVTEVIPENAVLKAGSVTGGGTVTGNTVRWTVTVEPGKTKTLTYTLIAGGARGDRIVLEGGNVAGIRSNSISIPVGGQGLTDAQKAALQNIKSQSGVFSGRGLEGAALANAVYETLFGIDPGIVSLQQYRDNLYELKVWEGSNGKELISKKAETPAFFAAAEDMMVPFLLGGTLYHADNCWERVMDLKFRYFLQPGDIILRNDAMYSGGTDRCFVYLGNNQVAYMKGDVLTVGNAESLLEDIFTAQYFTALRPSLAFDNLSEEARPLAFADVTSRDWFFHCVRPLVQKGIIKGKTETAFAPDDNLTYGEALKLLVVSAAGRDPGNSTTGHWADNYLAAAKDLGWISGGIDPDAPITRLAFCILASKASGLMAQPASNPFTDTNNLYVLALYNAGVIDGMTATTFAPSGLLTRAQIAKILFLLEQL